MRLLVQFTDDELSDFRWAVFDETAASADFDWQLAAEGELAALAAQHPYPLILVVPQQSVYLTQVELPEKASRQLLGAIEYQVEDRLAQDVESQHFALGDTRRNPIAVAVVARDIMDRCMLLAQTHGLRLAQVIPELFLCPWSGEGVSLAEGCDGWLLRYDDYRGVKCNTAALPAMLALIGREAEFDRIRCYGEPPQLDGFSIEPHALAEARPGFVDAPFIDLQQRDYQLSSPWLGLARAWRWVGLLLLLLVAVFGYNRAVALQQLESELGDLRQQQFELLRPYLPAANGPGDDLKRMLIERVRQLRAGRQEQGFLSLMLEFVRAREKFPDIEIARIGYQGGRLSFEISSKKLNDIESLLASVKQRGVQAKLESLNIKPELSSARLVMGGGSDA